MKALLATWAILVVTVKRLIAHRWLALATILGLVTAVAFTVSIPLYADAVYYRVLTEQLAADTGGMTVRPPLAFRFRRVSGLGRRTEWEDIRVAEGYFAEAAGPALGLPVQLFVQYLQTKPLPLYPLQRDGHIETGGSLTRASLASASGLKEHIAVVEGDHPRIADATPDSTVEALVSEYLVAKLGLGVGETYVVYDRRWDRDQTLPIPVRVSGIWRANDPQDEFWFYHPSAFDLMLLVPQETFQTRISAHLDDEIYLAIWHLVMDGSEVHAGDVEPLIARIARVQQDAAELEANLEVSPVDKLRAYRLGASVLTSLLYAFGVPIVGLILAFIGLVMELSVGDVPRSPCCAAVALRAGRSWGPPPWKGHCWARERSPWDCQSQRSSPVSWAKRAVSSTGRWRSICGRE